MTRPLKSRSPSTPERTEYVFCHNLAPLGSVRSASATPLPGGICMIKILSRSYEQHSTHSASGRKWSRLYRSWSVSEVCESICWYMFTREYRLYEYIQQCKEPASTSSSETEHSFYIPRIYHVPHCVPGIILWYTSTWYMHGSPPERAQGEMPKVWRSK